MIHAEKVKSCLFIFSQHFCEILGVEVHALCPWKLHPTSGANKYPLLHKALYKKGYLWAIHFHRLSDEIKGNPTWRLAPAISFGQIPGVSSVWMYAPCQIQYQQTQFLYRMVPLSRAQNLTLFDKVKFCALVDELASYIHNQKLLRQAQRRIFQRFFSSC